MQTSSSDIQQEITRNYRYNGIVVILNGAFWAFSASFIARQTILPLYVSRFTDSKLLIGLLSAISTAAWFLPQLFTVNWTQRLPRKKMAPVNVGLFTERLPVLLLVPSALLALRSPTLALTAFFVLFAWHVLGNGVVGVGFQDMLAKVLPLNRRGRIMGSTQFIGTGLGILGAAAAGWLLGNFEFPYGYMLCFAAAAVLLFISWFWLAIVREPAQVSDEPAISQREYWRRLPAILRNDPNYRRYLIVRTIINLGAMATGFLAVYAVQRWQLPDDRAATFTASMLIGQALSNLLFGLLIDRKGPKLVLELGTLSIALAVGLALWAPNPNWFHVVFALVGASMGTRLSGMMLAFEFSTPAVRPTYIGVGNTANGIANALAPILGGWLAGAAGYHTLFITAVAAGLLGVAALHWLVRDPRQVGSACEPSTPVVARESSGG